MQLILRERARHPPNPQDYCSRVIHSSTITSMIPVPVQEMSILITYLRPHQAQHTTVDSSTDMNLTTSQVV